MIVYGKNADLDISKTYEWVKINIHNRTISKEYPCSFLTTNDLKHEGNNVWSCYSLKGYPKKDRVHFKIVWKKKRYYIQDEKSILFPQASMISRIKMLSTLEIETFMNDNDIVYDKNTGLFLM